MPSVELLTPLGLVDWIDSVLVLCSLKNSFSTSPVSRLTPLKLESWAVLSSWSLELVELRDQVGAHGVAGDRVAFRCCRRACRSLPMPVTVSAEVDRLVICSWPALFDALIKPVSWRWR